MILHSYTGYDSIKDKEAPVKECTKFNSCSFPNCDKSYHLLTSIDHFIEDYCKGEKRDDCIRLKIENHNGKIHVPSNMMPNGLPLPGTHRRDWDEVALEFKKHI